MSWTSTVTASTSETEGTVLLVWTEPEDSPDYPFTSSYPVSGKMPDDLPRAKAAAVEKRDRERLKLRRKRAAEAQIDAYMNAEES